MKEYSCSSCICRECSRRTSKNCASCPYCNGCDGKLCWSGTGSAANHPKRSWLHDMIGSWAKNN
ncbi:MAG: hypothetical protein LKE51_04695 [Selenomonas sp.]|nr:hypothetical protein [Selenomonas sp.]